MRKWIGRSLLVPFLFGCVTLTVDPRAVISGSEGTARVMSLNCDAAAQSLRSAGIGDASDSLDPHAFRVMTWNVHKQADAGWEHDLAAFAAASDVMLLQETVLHPPLRTILGDSGLRWVMASSFLYDSNDIGVLTATRIAPIASCTQRAVEPIIRIPKSAVISWLRIAGSQETLAVANIHAINFELALDAYRAQLRSLADALAEHHGPIIVAGDFNTWSDARTRILAETASRLGLVEVKLLHDERSLFFGRPFDSIFVRGLGTVDANAIPVKSSDHNPVAATFHVL